MVGVRVRGFSVLVNQHDDEILGSEDLVDTVDCGEMVLQLRRAPRQELRLLERQLELKLH